MTSLSSNQSNQSFLHNHPFPSVCLDFPLIFLRFHTCVESPLNFFQVPYLPRNLPPPFPPGLDRPRRAERKRIERESARFEETQRWAGRHAPFSPVVWTEPHCAFHLENIPVNSQNCVPTHIFLFLHANNFLKTTVCS